MNTTKKALVAVLCMGLPLMAQYKAVEVANGGSISGVVKKTGEIPKDPMLVVEQDMEFCGEKIAAEHYVISAAGEVKNAVAMIDGIKEGAALDVSKPAFIDNLKCRNEPRVIVAPKGGEMTYKNSDPINHTAHYYYLGKNGKDAKKDLINQAMPNKDMVVKHKKPLRAEGLVSVECDPHTFEMGWVWVLDNPYGAVTDAKGAFKISNVPAGKHKLKVWHEKLGIKEIEVEVKAGADTQVKIDY